MLDVGGGSILRLFIGRRSCVDDFGNKKSIFFRFSGIFCFFVYSEGVFFLFWFCI